MMISVIGNRRRGMLLADVLIGLSILALGGLASAWSLYGARRAIQVAETQRLELELQEKEWLGRWIGPGFAP